jgi:hypothetical protein
VARPLDVGDAERLEVLLDGEGNVVSGLTLRSALREADEAEEFGNVKRARAIRHPATRPGRASTAVRRGMAR